MVVFKTIASNKAAWLLTGALLTVSQGAGAWIYSAEPIGTFSEELIFTTSQASLKAGCPVPPALLLTASRDHPNRKTQFTLAKNSPYKSVINVKSDAFDTKNPMRHYEDQVSFNDSAVIITLTGEKNKTKNTNSGSWSDTNGCKGNFVAK